jgi:outer membrane protein TolC
MKYNLCFWLIFLVCYEARAQINSSDTLEVSLDQAEHMALNDNLNYLMSMLSVEAAEYRVKEAKGNYLPDINISGSYTRNIKRPVFFLPQGENSPFGGNGGVIEAGFDNSYMATARANVPVFNERLLNQIRIAEIQEELTESQLQQQKDDIISQVRQTFFNTLLALESFQVLEQNLENARENFQNVQNLFSAGLSPEYDVIRAEVQVENLRPQRENALNSYQASLNQLKLLLNIPMEIPVNLQNSLADYYQEYDEVDLPEPMVRSNPELENIRIQARLQQQQIELSASAFYPSLSLFGNYQYQAQANNYNFSEYRWVNTSAAGVQLNIPVFAGFTRFNQVNQAEVELQRVELLRNYTRKSLSVRANNALNQVLQARSLIEAQQTNIRQAEKGYQIAQVSYEKGVSTQLDVNDARFALTQARLNRIQAINDYLVALVNYQQVTGTKIFEIHE